MMKTIILLFFMSMTGITAFGQEKHTDTLALRTLSADGTQYRASNGKVYKKGEVIQLGSGTGTNRLFIHVNVMVGNLIMKTIPVDRNYAGGEMVIDEIRKEKGVTKRVYAVIKMKTVKLAIFIESGLASGEVKQ